MNFSLGSYVVTINVATVDALLMLVKSNFLTDRGFALSTLNLDHLVKLSSSQPFREAYAAQDLIVADGNPIVWLSRLAGTPVKLVPGADMVIPLARLAANTGVPVALVGSTSQTLAKTSALLEKQIPGLSVVNCIAPNFGFDPFGKEADAIYTQLETSGARLCFVALGAPKQEIFAARGRAAVPNIGFASIGAGLDFIAGEQTRAPGWVRAMALEWAWRLFTNPRRMGVRYLQCALILPRHMRNALRDRLQHRTE